MTDCKAQNPDEHSGTPELPGANLGENPDPDWDSLLDQVENLVDGDAQSFVQGFVQKGGE